MKKICGVIFLCFILISSNCLSCMSLIQLKNVCLHGGIYIDVNGRTFLHRALVEKCSGEYIVRLLNAGEKNQIHIADKDGRTPLHWALINKYPDYIIQMMIPYKHEHITELLRAGDNKNVNVQDNEGRTPLHWALINEYSFDIVQQLVTPENVNIADHEGKTPLFYGLYMKRPGVEELFLHGGQKAIKDFMDKYGFTERTPAVKFYYVFRYDVLEILVTAGANVKARDNIGKTPLFKVLHLPRGVLRFMKYGADLCCYGQTPLSVALSSRDLFDSAIRIHAQLNGLSFDQSEIILESEKGIGNFSLGTDCYDLFKGFINHRGSDNPIYN